MFRTLLLDLSNALTSNDLSELKFICREEIPPGRAERITRPFEFFTALEQLNLLAEENRDFLAAKLIAINRNDLRNKLLGIQGGVDVEQSTQAGSRDDSPGIHNVPVSDRLIHEIVEDLSTSWKMLGRRLNLPESLLRNIDIENHRVVEKGVEMFTVWKERKGNDASVASLRKGLEKIGRRDLSEKVRDIITHEQESSVSVVEREHQGNPVQESHCLPDVEVASHVPLIQWPASDLPQPEEQVELYHLSLKQPTVPLQPVDGSPSAVCEERQSFPCLDDLDPALYVQQSQQQVVDQHYTALDSSLPVRLNRPSLGTEENIPDWPDGSTSMSAPIQVQSGRSLQLTVDGNYLDPEKYEPVKLIGSGGFAKVYLCTSTATGEQLAVKMIDLGMNDQETQKQVKNVSNEVKILASVKSDYIVKFHYSEECGNTLLIFLEYMPGGSIEMLLRHKGALQEPVVRKFTWQILNGVKFLHNKGIIHRDIKGGNILLDEAQDNIKIADFGISKIMNRLVTSTGGLKTNNKVVASFYWTSPELLSDKPFSRNTDIWSVGCTVVEMLTTLPPLLSQDLDLQQAMCKILQFEVRPPGDCSSEAYGFLEKCFCPQEKRPSASDLLENDPFAQYPVS